MEYLIKQQQQQQKREKFSGVGQDSKEVLNNTAGTRIPPQQTESFKRDKKAQNWFQGQFSSQMSHDFDSEDSDHTTAIAAATFAIYSDDESRLRQNQRNNVKEEGLKTPMTRANTRKEDLVWLPEPGGVSRRLSRNETKGREASMRKPTGREEKSLSNVRPGPPATSDEKFSRNSTRGRSAESEVEAWVRAETAKIQKRYEKLNSRILAWENEKKMKAKLQMERKKGELEQKRARNSQHYQSKLARIDNIAGGARKKLEEKRKKEETKLQEKAKMRSSGKTPTCCLCF